MTSAVNVQKKTTQKVLKPINTKSYSAADAVQSGQHGSALGSNIGVYTYTAGLDIGNGYVKGIIEATGDTTGTSVDVIDMPSAASRISRPTEVPEPDDTAVAVTGADFFNHIDTNFNSPMVKGNYRYLCGTRSLSARGSLEEFDLVGNRSKAEQELSKVLVMAVLAAKAVKDFVAAHGRIPQVAVEGDPGVLRVHAHLALALPINEYVGHRHGYKAQFMGDGAANPAVHVVTVNNFETPVTVQLIFERVEVIAEGASAQYAITAGGEVLMNGMLADVRSKGLVLEGVTAGDVLQARHTIGVDVGEGTVNFPVFTDGRFNHDASRAYDKGYGTVLESAIQAMDDAGLAHNFNSRKQLADYLQRPPSALKRNFYTRVEQHVDQEAVFFVQDVAAEFARVLSDVGALTEVAFVYGGGSGPLRDRLHEALLIKAAEMGSEDTFPVLYLDSAYSRKLNREGLMIAARSIAAKARK